MLKINENIHIVGDGYLSLKSDDVIANSYQLLRSLKVVPSIKTKREIKMRSEDLMNDFTQYRIIVTETGCELILYLDTKTEFSSEFGTELEPVINKSLKNQVQSFIISRKLAMVQIKRVTIMQDRILIASFNLNDGDINNYSDN